MPDMVGLPFHIGRDVAFAAGLSLANPNPDGTPIGALAWPGLFYITSQAPAGGTEASRWDSVAVEIVQHGTEESPSRPHDGGPPPHDTEHASREKNVHVDLTERDQQS